MSRGIPAPPMAAVYVPDASHASFLLWRELQWCEGDAGNAMSVEPSESVKLWAANAAREHRHRMGSRARLFDTAARA